MASTLALGPVQAAMLAKLKAMAPIASDTTGVVIPATRIVDHQVGVLMPYVLVKGIDDLPFNTMGAADQPKWGGIDTLRVRVVSQYRGEVEVYELMSKIKIALDGQPLTVVGFPTAIVAWGRADMLEDTINNIVTRELVGTFSVTAHQSS
jgi:hypothetical protein